MNKNKNGLMNEVRDKQNSGKSLGKMKKMSKKTKRGAGKKTRNRTLRLLPVVRKRKLGSR